MRDHQPPGRQHYRHGTPIEEAPLWALAIFAALLWLVAFPALAGLLAGWGAWHGQRLAVALAALVLSVLVVAALATRKPWRRRTAGDLHDERPLLVRFSTWLWTALLLPNVLFGVLVLTHEGPPLTYESALLLGLLVSAIHGLFALADRVKGRRRTGQTARSQDDDGTPDAWPPVRVPPAVREERDGER
jgi:membrane protease YdiL (CAAX protease family)